LSDTKISIKNLEKQKVKTVLDYGAEAKELEADWENTKNEFVKAIRFAANLDSVPIISVKITGLTSFQLLEKISANQSLTIAEEQLWERTKIRIKEVGTEASSNNMSVFIDAEESWIQDAVDSVTNEMMSIFNKEKVVFFNTFQMYRHDRLDFLKKTHEEALSTGYFFGAKLVRGAYMEKERNRAAEMGYPSPINPDKESTDNLYNEALIYCFQNLSTISVCNATHNRKSNELLADLLLSNQIATNHPHTLFCQLYGMSDNITFNLADSGFNASKYMPYGPIKDVIPYLIRRANENTAVSGDMSREYKMYVDEAKRRKI